MNILMGFLDAWQTYHPLMFMLGMTFLFVAMLNGIVMIVRRYLK